MLKLLSIILLTFSMPAFQSAAFFGTNFAPAASSGITYVGTCDNGGSGVTTIACTVTGVPAGSTIVFAVVGASAATSATDSGGGTPTQIGSNTSWNAGGQSSNIWYVANAVGGSHTLTANFSGLTNFTRIQALVFTGANISAPIDTNHGFASGVGLAVDSGSYSTTTANDMLVAFIFGSGTTGITAGSPPSFTIVQAATGAYFAAEYAIASTATSYNATAGITPSSQWVVLAVALKQ